MSTARHRPRYSREREIEKFWQRVQKGDGCWEWTAGKLNRGTRGVMQWRGNKVLAYRVSWEIEHGTPPPADLHVCHHCDNGLCVRPSHLFLGDDLANVRDAQRKGRMVPPPLHMGETHPGARYSDEFVRQARERVALAGRGSIIVIAEELGMNPGTLRDWVSGHIRINAGGPTRPPIPRAKRGKRAPLVDLEATA